MDFHDSPEETRFRSEARAWLEANAELRAPDATPKTVLPEGDDQETVRAAKDWQARKADAGWACLSWPVEYGGRGAPPIQQAIWGQEESRFDVPPDLFVVGTGLAGPTLIAHGNDGQKAQWLPPLARGDEIWCQLFSEPGAGSDLAGLRTRAERDGDLWRVNGQKIWTSGAQFSRWGLLVTRTDPSVSKHAGLTYFVVDMQSSGIDVRPITQISGARGFNEVFLSDVRIPDSQRISEVGNGWGVALTTLANERALIGFSQGGVRLEDLIALAREVGVLHDASIRERIADFCVRLRAIEFSGFRTLTTLSRGGIPGPEGSFGKLVFGALQQEMSSFAIELQGAAGSLADPEVSPQRGAWQENFLVAPGLRIGGGTDEILRNIIGERVLGLPPEPRRDKGIPFRDIPS